MSKIKQFRLMSLAVVLVACGCFSTDLVVDGVVSEVKAVGAKWPGFSCGIGFGGWLTNYKRFNVIPVDRRMAITEGDLEHFDSYISEADVERVARWGFDHVRVGFDQIVLEEQPGVWRERTFRRLDDFVGWCGNHKLNVVLNLHKAVGNYCDIKEEKSLFDDDELQNRFVALWAEIERRYHDRLGIAFELLNEVRDVDPEKWNALADRTIREIRRLNPERWIVVGPVGWNNPPKLPYLKVWDDPKVVYTFHMYWPTEFTHQRGVLQEYQLAYNRELVYPSTDVSRYADYYTFYGWKNPFEGVERIDRDQLAKYMKPAFDFVKAHTDKILWNGEFGTIRHAPATSRIAYMRDVISLCREHGIPWCVWNYLSTPNDGNRFSLVDDDTREFLSDELRLTCLGKGDHAADGELKYITFNIWGPYFGNPVCERVRKITTFLKRENADIVGFQECEKAFWGSDLFAELEKAGYGWIADGQNLARNLNPLLYKKERLEVLESGVQMFRKEDNPQGSKGFTWGVFRDRATGRKFYSYSTHFWWRLDSGAAYEKNEAMRMRNVRELLTKCDEVSKRYGELPVVGGGDLNSTLLLRKSALGEFAALGLNDAQYTVKGASPWSSHHGDPQRDENGELRAFFQPGSDNPSNSLDHVHYRGVEPITLKVDRSRDAMESSDHSPVIFTFRLK